MTQIISHCDDVSVIAPILRVLRDTIPDETFKTRLRLAMEDGYQVLITSQANASLGYRITNDVFWGKTLFVDDLVVAENARGQGLGGALIAQAKSEARTQNCDHMRLCSGLTRKAAHRFYEQNGFTRSSLQFVQVLESGAS